MPTIRSKSPQSDRLEDHQFKCGRCTACKLHANRKLPIVGVGGSDNPDIVLVADRTSVSASVVGNIFAGREGSILANLIELSKIDTDSLWVTPCVSCPTEKHRPGKRNLELFPAPKAASIKACRNRLHAEIRILEPNMLVAMGPSAVDALRGEYNFTGSNGRVVEASIIGEEVDFKLPMMVLDSVMTLLRTAQNPGRIWNKNLANLRLAETISKELKEQK